MRIAALVLISVFALAFAIQQVEERKAIEEENKVLKEELLPDTTGLDSLNF